MSESDVAELVGHHTGHLTFTVRRLDHAAVHVHWTTGQSERVYVSRVYDFEVVLKFGMLKLRWNGSHQPAPYTLHITSHLLVVKQGKLAFGFLGSLPSEFDVILNAKFVVVICDLCLRESRQRHHGQGDERYPRNHSLSLESVHCYLQYSRYPFSGIGAPNRDVGTLGKDRFYS